MGFVDVDARGFLQKAPRAPQKPLWDKDKAGRNDKSFGGKIPPPTAVPCGFDCVPLAVILSGAERSRTP